MDIQTDKQVVSGGRGRPASAASITVSTTEAATWLNCTRQNVADLHKRGQLTGPPRESRAPIRLYRASVEAYEQSRTRRTQHPSKAQPDEQAAELDVQRLHDEMSQLRTIVEHLLTAEHERGKRLEDIHATHTATDDAEQKQFDVLIRVHESAIEQLVMLKEQHRNARMRWTQHHEAAIPEPAL